MTSWSKDRVTAGGAANGRPPSLKLRRAGRGSSERGLVRRSFSGGGWSEHGWAVRRARTREGFDLRTCRLPSFACLLPCLLTIGCAVGAIPGEIVYQDPTTFVRIEPDPAVIADEPETFHGHPRTIATEDFRAILGGFRVRDHRLGVYAMLAGDAPWRPVFTGEELDVLAPPLSEALARAGPSELVTYYLSQPRTSIKREVTSGGFYVQGNRLHFVIANHDVQYGVPAHGLVYDRRFPMRPTSPKWFDVDFEPEGAVVEQSYTMLDFFLGREKDEVVIDLGKLGLGLPVVWSAPPVR